MIALYDAKYAYHFWRPVTAVRAAGTDGNDATAGDPAWLPLLNAGVPGVVRSFHSFSAAADEAAASRILAGQHFLFDENAGQALGDQVGDLVSHSCF